MIWFLPSGRCMADVHSTCRYELAALIGVLAGVFSGAEGNPGPEECRNPEMMTKVVLMLVIFDSQLPEQLGGPTTESQLVLSRPEGSRSLDVELVSRNPAHPG